MPASSKRGYICAGADTQLMSQPVAVSANARFDASARHVLSLPAGVGLAETLGRLSGTWELAFQVGTKSCQALHNQHVDCCRI